MRVLVTGAGGFVGRHIVRAMLDARYDVIAWDRQFDVDLLAMWAGSVTTLTGEIGATTLQSLSYDAYVHAAALTATPEESGLSAVATMRANLDPMLALLEAHPTRRGILLSSDAVFRTTTGAIHETDMPSPLGLYAVAKRTLEQLVETLHIEHKQPVIAIRLSRIYGTDERPRATRPRMSLIAQWLDEARSRGTLTLHRPTDQHTWTFAEDVRAAIVALLQASQWQHPLYHVANPELLSNATVAESIVAKLPGVKIVMPPEQALPHPRQGYLVSERLQQDTGFHKWTPFAVGLQRLLQPLSTGVLTS
jgi:nucleoside-diphosphate-sugar epimerase